MAKNHVRKPSRVVLIRWSVIRQVVDQFRLDIMSIVMSIWACRTRGNSCRLVFALEVCQFLVRCLVLRGEWTYSGAIPGDFAVAPHHTEPDASGCRTHSLRDP